MVRDRQLLLMELISAALYRGNHSFP